MGRSRNKVAVPEGAAGSPPFSGDIFKGPARVPSILGIRPPGLPEEGTPRHLGNCIARDMFGSDKPPNDLNLISTNDRSRFCIFEIS